MIPPQTDEEIGKMRGNLHPLVLALVDELPTPGNVWPSDERDAWINAASSIFDLIYQEKK